MLVCMGEVGENLPHLQKHHFSASFKKKKKKKKNH